MRLPYMENLSLTGAQKSKLRGLGQKLEATIKVGKEGLTPAFFTELSRALRAHDLIKLRFVGDADRAALLERFGDIDRLRRASAEQLAQVDGFGGKLAAELHHF
ncbi:MAG: YhbY family RNA-binding protein, partial [Opitutaceae bacterium]|nr:YhbY family RNA-binding protein [Opitutaceae bacterium]